MRRSRLLAGVEARSADVVSRSMYPYGSATQILRPLGAERVAEACSLPEKRVRRMMRQSGLWFGHTEGRRLVALADRVVAGGRVTPGCSVEPGFDFRALLAALHAAGWGDAALERRTGIPLYCLSNWATGARSPSYIGGEVLLRWAGELLPDAETPSPVE